MDSIPERHMRVSDAERDSVVAKLRDHLTEGRLTTDEFSDRVEKALVARTWGDLMDLTADLPMPSATRSPHPTLASHGADRTGQRWAQLRRRLSSFVMPNAVCIAIWAMTGHGAFWPEWVLFGTGIPFLGWILQGDRQIRREEDAGVNHRLPGSSGAELGARRFAAVAFVDIVGSTQHALELGDRRWSEVLQRHVDLADEELGDCGGQLVFQKGDEVVAAFDRPGRAIDWARAVRRNAGSLGLTVRTGIHAGEVESYGHQLSGVALHIGQRVSASAQPGEILVTSTVQELVAGSGTNLVDCGVRELRGLDQPWRVFRVEEP